MASIFNINNKHVQYVRALLKQKDIVIIHGDGHIFASNNGENFGPYVDDETGELKTVPFAIFDSNHHKTYNSGYKESEATARGGHRAIYRKGDKAPETVEDIEKAFFAQASKDLQDSTTARVEVQSNIFSLEAEPESTEQVKEKKSGKASKAEPESTNQTE